MAGKNSSAFEKKYAVERINNMFAKAFMEANDRLTPVRVALIDKVAKDLGFTKMAALMDKKIKELDNLNEVFQKVTGTPYFRLSAYGLRDCSMVSREVERRLEACKEAATLRTLKELQHAQIDAIMLGSTGPLTDVIRGISAEINKLMPKTVAVPIAAPVEVQYLEAGEANDEA